MKKGVIVTIVVAVIVVAGGIVVLANQTSPNKNKTNSSSNHSTPSENAPAVNNAVVNTKTAANVGQYLTDPTGRPLYTFGGDMKGTSNCTGSCLAEWPAYVDNGATTGLPAGIGTITRTDNQQVQYTYLDMPLYFFIHDSSGQVTGNNVSNFVVARPQAGTSSGSSNTNTNKSNSNNSSGTYDY